MWENKSQILKGILYAIGSSTELLLFKLLVGKMFLGRKIVLSSDFYLTWLLSLNGENDRSI